MQSGAHRRSAPYLGLTSIFRGDPAHSTSLASGPNVEVVPIPRERLQQRQSCTRRRASSLARGSTRDILCCPSVLPSHCQCAASPVQRHEGAVGACTQRQLNLARCSRGGVWYARWGTGDTTGGRAHSTRLAGRVSASFTSFRLASAMKGEY